MRDIKDALLPSGYVIDDVIIPEVGVTLVDMDAFIAKAKSAGYDFEGKSTGQVNDFMKTITKDRSYCEYIGKNQSASVSVFICFYALYIEIHPQLIMFIDICFTCLGL
jgi:hypothetical protein